MGKEPRIDRVHVYIVYLREQSMIPLSTIYSQAVLIISLLLLNQHQDREMSLKILEIWRVSQAARDSLWYPHLCSIRFERLEPFGSQISSPPAPVLLFEVPRDDRIPTTKFFTSTQSLATGSMMENLDFAALAASMDEATAATIFQGEHILISIFS